MAFDPNQFDAIFRITSTPQTPPELSESEKEFVNQLNGITPMESILDEGEVEARCKAIGQEIFDKYKQENNGDSMAAKVAAQRICNSIAFTATDGKVRKQFVERAWAGIGDKNWRWIP